MNQIAPINELRSQVMHEDTASQLRMVLPKHIGVEKFQRVVMTAVSKNQDLIGADRPSLLNSCIECATDGLLPNGRESALVIFNTKITENGKDKWIKKVQYMPMIAGIYKLARNSGELKFLYADIVHRNDDFDYEKGFNVRCDHVPNIDDPGAIRGVYAVAETKDGTRYAEYMPLAEVEKVRATSKTSKSGPWVTFWEEMAKKTVIRRLSKVLPLTPEIERIIQSVDHMYDFEENREMKDVTIPSQPQRSDYLPPAHMNDALDGGDNDSKNVSRETIPEEETPDEFTLITRSGEVLPFPTIDDWKTAALKGINKLSTKASLELFRERHGAIMADLSTNYSIDVGAVSNALTEALSKYIEPDL